MKFEALKDFTVMNGKEKKLIRAGKSLDSRDLGIADKSMAEMSRGGFLHIEKGQPDAPTPARVAKEVK